MRKQTMSYKIANLANNELASIFGGEGCAACYCYSYNYTKKSLSSLKDFIMHLGLNKSECKATCDKTHKKYLCQADALDLKQSNVALGNKLLENACFTPIYDRSSSAYENIAK